VAQVVVSPAFPHARAHGQQRRRTFQGLNLALFIDTQHQGVVGRVQVQANHVAHFVDEQGVAAQLEGFRAVGWRAKARQMRLMAVWFSPAAWAMDRVDQWVASAG